MVVPTVSKSLDHFNFETTMVTGDSPWLKLIFHDKPMWCKAQIAEFIGNGMVLATVYHSIRYFYWYLRAAAPAADPGRIGKPSECIYGTGLHPPSKKKWGKDASGTVLHALLPVMVLMLKGNVRSLVLMVFCDVCCKAFFGKNVSSFGSGVVVVVRVLKFSFTQLRFEKKGMYY